MTRINKDAKSQTGQITENKNISGFKEGTTLDDQVNLLLFEMLNYPVYCGEGYPHIKFDDLIAKTGLTQHDVISALETYGLQDPKGKWSPEVLLTGLIANIPYIGMDATNDEINDYNYDLCTPHGHMFFEVFFSLLKIWNWKTGELIKPSFIN